MNGKSASLVRRIGSFDLTMIVMGGIIGAGIFMNPSVVARQIHTPFLILLLWGIGGAVALIGAFVYAELGVRRPYTGGQYAYLRDAHHPVVGFLYGWTLLFVIQTGGMAAVALTFARYFLELLPVPFTDATIAIIALLLLTIVNCLGVRAGSSVQSALMVLKIAAVIGLISCGLLWAGKSPELEQGPFPRWTDQPLSLDYLTVIGAGMIPVLFAYGGWQTSTFIAGEVCEPQRTYPRAMVIGVAGVVILYLGVNFVCVRALGSSGLAATSAPASDVMRLALGEAGARIIAAGIAISTLGFLSQSMLTAPRVYFAMAEDQAFFRSIAWVHPKTHVPVFAILLQGLFAIVIAVSGRYEQILSYVIFGDFIFLGLTAMCIFVFRRQNATGTERVPAVPGHPFTTVFFIVVCWIVVLNALYRYPLNSGIGMVIICAGIPAYILWKRNRKT